MIEHWNRIFGPEGCPQWTPFDSKAKYITLFPHESLTAEQQVTDPEMSYAIHSKEVIAKIACPQAAVLDSITLPCIVKLSHGYAGLGNFLLRGSSDTVSMEQQLAAHWPDSVRVCNALIEDVVNDFGVQFYLRSNGSIVWLGFTEQLFDRNNRWRGGAFSADAQMKHFDALRAMLIPVGEHLHGQGYFGLVGIDILRDRSDKMFLVDVNPRLTGASPFLMTSLLFAREGLKEGAYRASCQYPGGMEQLFEVAQRQGEARVVVMSAFEKRSEDSPGDAPMTICHLSVSADSQERCQQVFDDLLGV